MIVMKFGGTSVEDAEQSVSLLISFANVFSNGRSL